MTIPWEDNYIGIWSGTPSRELHIRKVKPRKYLATLLIDGKPIQRPWMNNEPTIDMPARYTFTAFGGSDFSIDLWTDERFELNLDYRPDFQIYDDPPCEAISMGTSRNVGLDFLDQYSGLLGGFSYLFRVNNEP